LLRGKLAGISPIKSLNDILQNVLPARNRDRDRDRVNLVIFLPVTSFHMPKWSEEIIMLSLRLVLRKLKIR
jgi:hypothetical protein